MNSSFTHLQGYSGFLLENHLDTVAKATIQKAREEDLPVLKLLTKFSAEEIFQISKKSLKEDILLPLILMQGSPFEKIKEGIERWKANVIIIPSHQIDIADITAIHNVRRDTFLDFMEYYDCSQKILIPLIKEINLFFNTCIDLGLKAYQIIQQVELGEKNNMLSGILSNMPVIVTRLDKNGKIAFSVGAGLKSIGLKDQELIGKNIFDDYPNADNTKKALRGGTPFSFVGTAKSTSGELREFQTYYVPEKDGALGFSIDITRQRKAEEQFSSLVEAVKDYAIFMMNPDGTIASWNAGVYTLKGYTKEEIIGKHFSIFYTQEKIEENYPQYELEQARKIGRFEDEGLRVRKDGTLFFANVVITALYDDDQELIGYFKITRDLTERKKYEENLQRMNLVLEEKVKKRTEELLSTIQQLKRINNDLDNFIYTASHDLKAPISNIEGLIQGLYEELGGQTESNPILKTFGELIVTSIKRFQTTIKELTEIAKIQKNISESTEEIDLPELVEDVKISIADLILKNDARIIIDVSKSPRIKFVRKNLKSIFYNMISNGIKYRSPDRQPVIHVTCDFLEAYYLLTFQDNGLGMKIENIGKMFNMFKRFHDHVEGSGIGLYIVKRIIENAGGRIEVESTVGEGSTFKIYIPCNLEDGSDSISYS